MRNGTAIARGRALAGPTGARQCVAAILAGDFNDDLTAASRADSDYARSLCRVLWPRRAAGNENYLRRWVHENNRGEKTRKYDRAPRRTRLDHRWSWGRDHGHAAARLRRPVREQGPHHRRRHVLRRVRTGRCDARVVTDGDYADIDEDAGVLAAVMRHAVDTPATTRR